MLNPTKLGIAGGVLWGICMGLCTFLAVLTGYSVEFLNIMASIYIGYSISWIGVVTGLVYGFIDGFIGLSLLAWLYNKLPENLGR